MALITNLADRGLGFINELIFDELKLEDLCSLKSTNKELFNLIGNSKSWNRKILQKKVDIAFECEHAGDDCFGRDNDVIHVLERVIERNRTKELKLWGQAVFTVSENLLAWAIHNDRTDIIDNYYEVVEEDTQVYNFNPLLVEDGDDKIRYAMGKFNRPTMFELAAACNKLEIVETIIKNFHAKFVCSQRELDKLFIDHGNEKAIIAAMENGHSDLVKYLLDSQHVQIDIFLRKKLISATVREGQLECLKLLADGVSEKLNYPDDKCFCLLEKPYPNYPKKMRKYCDFYENICDWEEEDSENEYPENDILGTISMMFMSGDFHDSSYADEDSSYDYEDSSCDDEDSSCDDDEWEDIDDDEEEEAVDDENKKVLKLKIQNQFGANPDVTQLLQKILARNLDYEIKAWADICTKAGSKNPLRWAVDNGNTDVIEEYYKLADLNLNPQIFQDNGETISLYEYAASLNQFAIIKVIFQHYPSLRAEPAFAIPRANSLRISPEQQYNEKVLFAAIKNENIDLIKYLLNDLKMQIKSKFQRKLISCAFREGKGEILKLVANGLTKRFLPNHRCFGCCLKSAWPRL